MENIKQKPLKVFTAFSGYDSQCIALNRLTEKFPDKFPGYELVGWSEIEENAVKAHNALFEDATDKNYGDISMIDWDKVPDFDLFTYSSPCTDFSIAGKMLGGEEGSGTRSSLLWECKKAIEAKKPKYLLLENVPALAQGNFKLLFEKWQKYLETLGYKNFYAILNAKDYGVRQNRDRLFLVSIKEDNENEEAVSYNFPNPYSEDKIKDWKEFIEDEVPEEYYIEDKKVEEWVNLNDEMIEVNKKNRNL